MMGSRCWYFLLLLALPSFSEEPLEKDQWALHNQGQGVRYLLRTPDSLWFPGKIGEDLHIPESSQTLPIVRSVKVGIIDSGIDVNHPDLKNQIFRREVECAAPPGSVPNDLDGNGYRGDCMGWNAIDDNGDMTDDLITAERGHGTHIAGIIAAEINGVGIAGIAPEVKLVPIKMIQKPRRIPNQESLSQEEIQEYRVTQFKTKLVRSLTYAFDAGVDVLSISQNWTPRYHSAEISELFQKLLSKGMLIVAGAPNTGSNTISFPCAEAGVICVGAHGPDGERAYFSDFGETIDLYAPGVSILSTYLKSSVNYFNAPGYDLMSGTSMAAPMVAGTAAWLLLRGVPPKEIVSRILSNARTQEGREGRNLDLGNAWSGGFRPWIAAVKKTPVKVVFSRAGFDVPIQVVNRGADMIAPMIASIRWLEEDGTPSTDFTFSNQSIVLPALAQGEIYTVPISVKPKSIYVSGRGIVELKSEDGNISLRAGVAIEVPFGVFSQKPVIKRPLLGAEILHSEEDDLYLNYEIIDAKDGQDRQDFLLSVQTEDSLSIQFVREEFSHFQVLPKITYPSLESEGELRVDQILRVERIRIREEGAPVYAVWFNKSKYQKNERNGPPADSDTPGPPPFSWESIGVELRTYSEEGREIEGSDYGPVFVGREQSQIGYPFQFTWVRYGKMKTSPLRPTWIGIGPIPSPDLPPFDPFDPMDPTRRDRRLYTIDDDKRVRIYPLEDKERLIGLFPGADAWITKAKNDRFHSEIRSFHEGAWEVGRAVTLNPLLSLFESEIAQMTLSFADVLAVPSAGIQPRPFQGLGLRKQGGIGSAKGGVRIMALSEDGAQIDIEFSTPKIEMPYKVALGIFSGGTIDEASASAFAMGEFGLTYKEIPSGEEANALIRKNSFETSDVQREGYTPQLIRFDGRLVPALLVPDGAGDSPGITEWVVPIRTEKGELRLIRPAVLRQRPENDCYYAGFPRVRSLESEVELWLRCGDEIQSLSIGY